MFTSLNPMWRRTVPLSLQNLVYLDGKILYRSKMNPSLGRNFEAMALAHVDAA